MKIVTSLVVLIPYFEDEKALLELLSKLKSINQKLYLVIVDDGSISKFLTLEPLANKGIPGTLIRLKRNTGPQRAIATGLTFIYNEIDTEHVLIMDSDGEDQPENIPALLKFKQLNPGTDIVVASRLSRKNSFSFKFLYFIYKFMFRTITGKSMNFGHFSLISKNAVSRIINYSELWLHLGSTYIVSKLNIASIPLPKGPKYDDRPGSGYLSLINHGIRSIIALSELMISRIFVFCSLSAAVITTATLWSLIFNSGIDPYLGMLSVLFIVLNCATIMLFLGLARNAGEYSISSYEQLIEETLDF